MRDPDTGNSKGYAFINFASFEAADAALEAMNGQFLCNRAISISFAFKKDSKGERHGSAAGIKFIAWKRLIKPLYSFLKILFLINVIFKIYITVISVNLNF